MDKSIAIMQPYFLPYIGYFQLINNVDQFVLYDNIKYTKKGWINRNRITGGNVITIPIKKDSDSLDIVDRKLSNDWLNQKRKLFNKIKSSYIKSFNYKEGIELLNNILEYKSNNLFEFIYNSIIEINSYLDIKTPIIPSSLLKRDRNLKSQDSVIEICNILKANKYINPIGGKELYIKKDFNKKNINLIFIENTYVNNFSILDIIMNNSKLDIKNKFLNNYILV
mgnify:CR=1 FL=1